MSQYLDNRDLILTTTDGIVYRICEITMSLCLDHQTCISSCNLLFLILIELGHHNLISSCALHKNTLLQVEQAQAGLKSLSSSEKTINQLRENFVSIEKYVKNETD